MIRVVCHWCLFWLGSVFLSRKLYFIFLPLALRFAHQNQLIRLVCHWCAILLGWHSLAGSCTHLSSSSCLQLLRLLIFSPLKSNLTGVPLWRKSSSFPQLLILLIILPELSDLLIVPLVCYLVIWLGSCPFDESSTSGVIIIYCLQLWRLLIFSPEPSDLISLPLVWYLDR